MRIKQRRIIPHNDDHDAPLTDVITLNKPHKRIEHRGLSLADHY